MYVAYAQVLAFHYEVGAIEAAVEPHGAVVAAAGIVAERDLRRGWRNLVFFSEFAASFGQSLQLQLAEIAIFCKSWHLHGKSASHNGPNE